MLTIQVVLSFLMAAGFASAENPAAPIEFPIVADVRFSGLQRVPEADVRKLLSVREGAPYHSDDRARDIKALKETGWFSSVQIKTADMTDTTIAVEVEVSEEMHPVRFIGAIDYFVYGNAIDPGYSSMVGNDVDIWKANGFAADSSVETSGAIGARVGIMIPVDHPDGFELGASVGYIRGPSGEFTFSMTDPTGRILLNDRWHTDIFRFLLQGVKRVPLTEHWGLRLGAE